MSTHAKLSPLRKSPEPGVYLAEVTFTVTSDNRNGAELRGNLVPTTYVYWQAQCHAREILHAIKSTTEAWIGSATIPEQRKFGARKLPIGAEATCTVCICIPAAESGWDSAA